MTRLSILFKQFITLLFVVIVLAFPSCINLRVLGHNWCVCFVLQWWQMMLLKWGWRPDLRFLELLAKGRTSVPRWLSAPGILITLLLLDPKEGFSYAPMLRVFRVCWTLRNSKTFLSRENHDMEWKRLPAVTTGYSEQKDISCKVLSRPVFRVFHSPCRHAPTLALLAEIYTDTVTGRLVNVNW